MNTAQDDGARRFRRSGIRRRAVVVAACVNLFAIGCAAPSDPIANNVIKLSTYSQTELIGEVGVDVSDLPTVRATYADGRPATGATVLFRVHGGGTVTVLKTTTDTRGVASPGRWSLGPTAGRQRLVAYLWGSRNELVFNATALPGAATRIERIPGDDQLGNVGWILRDPLRVAVKDAYGNPLRGVSVTFRILQGAGEVEHTVAETDSNGVALGGDWRLGLEEGIQEVLAEGGNLRSVFTARACECVVSDLATLAYVRDGDVFVRELQGSEKRLTTNTQLDRSPAWSPDGLRLAFERVPGGLNWFGSIYTMRADGSDPVMLAHGGVAYSLRNPAWSPSGGQLAVTRGYGDLDMEILLVDETGSLSSPIALLATRPAWSPNGDRIAFVGAMGNNGLYALQVMNANGTGRTVLVVNDTYGLEHPTWSPDGRQIAFTRGLLAQVWVINADGTGLRKLTNFDGPRWGLSPAWSPDGRMIAIALNELSSDTQWITTVLVDGGSYTRRWQGESPAWRPDGR